MQYQTQTQTRHVEIVNPSSTALGALGLVNEVVVWREKGSKLQPLDQDGGRAGGAASRGSLCLEPGKNAQ